jgi:hypothetical protein
VHVPVNESYQLNIKLVLTDFGVHVFTDMRGLRPRREDGSNTLDAR